MTLRLRLTLWYSAVLAGIILLFGLIVYGIMVFSLLRQTDMHLTATARAIIGASQLRDLADVQIVTLPALDRFGATRVYVQVWNSDGSLVSSSDNLDLVGYRQPLDARALTSATDSHREVYVENVHLWVVTEPIMAPDGRILGYVQAASQLTEVNAAKNALLIVLVGGGVAAVMLATLVGWMAARRALQPLETITHTALQITRADDLSRRISMAGAPRDEVGRLALAFNESLERLERLFITQRRFLADVSHELRTPLTVIRGNVDLLRRMGGVDAQSLDAIQSEAERMSRLVGDLLLLAQADAGTLPLSPGQVELDTLLLEVYHESQVLAGGVNLVISEIDQVIVVGDRDRLKQLLLNLVSNGLKFTPDGGRVTLSLARVKDWARLVVSDSGVGIPADELANVFDRFYRVDKARNRSKGGAGLGLAIAQRIAQVHGGRIEASSDGIGGHGSTFSVLLPLAPARSAAESAAALETTRPLGLLQAKKTGG